MILHLHLDDECPVIGSGVRPVEICSIGRKWAWLRKPGNANRFRIPVKGLNGFERLINAKNNRKAKKTLKENGVL